MRDCICADPENCTEPVPGYVCRKGRSGSGSGHPQERREAETASEKHRRERRAVALARINELTTWAMIPFKGDRHSQQDVLDAVKSATALIGEFEGEANDAEAEIAALRDAIRAHRDQRGDDRCWEDDERLYAVLPEGYRPPVRDTAVQIENCRRFIASRQHPATTYVSPEVEIASLRASLKIAQEAIDAQRTIYVRDNRQLREETVRQTERADAAEAQLKTAEQEREKAQQQTRAAMRSVAEWMQRFHDQKDQVSALLAGQERLIEQWIKEADDPTCAIDESNRNTRRMCAAALHGLTLTSPARAQ